MLKEMIIKDCGPVQDGEMEEVLKMVRDDVFANKILFAKRTNVGYLLQVAKRCLSLVRRVKCV